MRFRRRITSALRPLLTHPLRTTLAAAGVAVGVAAFVVSRAIGGGAEAEVARTVEAMGTDLLLVKPLPMPRRVARREITGLAQTLRPEDAAALAQLRLVRAVAPAIEDTLRVKVGGSASRVKVRGTTPEYLELRRYELAAGRGLTADDEQRAARVAVLGAALAQQFFPRGGALGGELRVRGVPFEIVGVLRAKGTTADGADQDQLVLVPLRTALRRVFNARGLTSTYVGVTEPARLAEAEEKVGALLRRRHGRADAKQPDDFAVQNTARTRAFQQEMTAALSKYGAGLAALALAVGGVGVLALMFVAVRERTSEIGLRIAIGAEPKDILWQFLIEAALLAVAGWLAGAILGGGACALIALTASWPMSVPTGAVIGALLMALGIGLGCGVLPARAAARIPPIEALTKR
ncbi:ABC transporter permease [Opitutus sp. ER46]|uniref:ABC transporter permease n=1 Tax=Opitutus sp. ER46 TaxID=2161864 RepID=UPI000D31E521|nr:ABC transporter permease [Opitutus sp. ER46]PTX95502.1 hypothetical protein DB354_08740 [Opitutus sp. ER46]